MSTPKWTAGPWVWGNDVEEVEPGSVQTTDLVGYGPPDANGNQEIIPVLDIWESGWPDQSPTLRVNPDNARLIMCAPLLYEALEQARTVIVLLVRSLRQDETLGDHTGVLDDAEQADLSATAALAKARGESQ